MKPYTYLIKHTPSGKVYYGYRSANKVEPHEDLWKRYFTSSPKVQRLIEETGIDSFDVEVRRVFETKEQASGWETRVLNRCRVLEDDRWINQNIAGYVVPTEESNKKISDYHKGKPKSKEQIEKIRKSNIGKNKGRIATEEHRQKNSEAHKGEKNGMYGKGCTPERAAKIGEANKGKTPANKGLPMSEEQKAILRETKERNKVVLTCEVCSKTMRASHFKMYGHGENCSQARAAHK
jgi:hypothetical protein